MPLVDLLDVLLFSPRLISLCTNASSRRAFLRPRKWPNSVILNLSQFSFQLASIVFPSLSFLAMLGPSELSAPTHVSTSLSRPTTVVKDREMLRSGIWNYTYHMRLYLPKRGAALFHSSGVSSGEISRRLSLWTCLYTVVNSLGLEMVGCVINDPFSMTLLHLYSK